MQRHSFVCCDPMTESFVWFDRDGNITRKWEGRSARFDVWQLPDGRVVYPHYGCGLGDGVSVLSGEGELLLRYQTKHEIFGCQPLPDGNILVGELRQKRIVEVTPDGKIAVEIPVEYPDDGNPHECMRMVRKVGENTYYAVMPGLNLIRRYDRTDIGQGWAVKEYPIRPDAFGVVIRPGGNIVYTCMSGAYELTPEGEEIWSLTDADVPEIGIRWLLGIQLLKNGNLVLTNWMGHGHHDEGVHFFEVTQKKEVVWSFDTRGVLGEPAVLQILDEDTEEVCFRPAK